MTPSRQLAAVSLCLALVGAACSSTDSGGSASDQPAAPAGRFALVTLEEGAVVASTGRFQVEVATDPLRLEARMGGEPVAAQADGGGLYLVRGGQVVAAESASVDVASEEGLVFGVTFADGSDGELEVTPVTEGTVHITLTPDDPTGVTHWGERLATPRDELVYGLTERIVTDFTQSEVAPTEVGSLNRKGEVVEMFVRPTISAYAPFHQTSRGYGLLVDGTMPGSYDVGATDTEVLDLRFELDPDADRPPGYHLFVGPGAPEILDEYTTLTGRAPVPPEEVFLHWRSRDELPLGAPVQLDGVDVNATFADDMAAYDRYGIPAGVYHLDRPWATGPEGYGDFTFDVERFPDPEGMLRLLDERGWATTVWTSSWAIGTRGQEAVAQGYLAPGSDRGIDFTDPEAVEWLVDDVVAFLDTPEGRYIDGFFIDRGEEGEVPSEAGDIYADGRNGRQVHNEYPVLMQQAYRDALDQARGDEGFAIARAAYTGTQGLVMTWGGDTRSTEGFASDAQDVGPTTDLGLRSVLISLQRAAFLGLPFWGSDIGGYTQFADREVFARWIQVGALSPLMRFHGEGTKAPWDMPTEPNVDDEMIAIYRDYVELHHSLQPYLVDLAEQAHATGLTPVRPLVFRYADQAAAQDRWDEWLLGDDLLVAPVWESGARSRSVWFPPGRWVSWWDHQTVVEGPIELEVPAPLGILPLYVAEGSDLLGR
jgi:alpha-glucosidase (family GH31 glycosyl hydrolase)